MKKACNRVALELLQHAAQDGYVNLKCLDESGFCLWSLVSYDHSRVGYQKHLEKTALHCGNCISILGMWQPGKQFGHGLNQGGFKSSGYIFAPILRSFLTGQHSHQ